MILPLPYALTKSNSLLDKIPKLRIPLKSNSRFTRDIEI